MSEISVFEQPLNERIRTFLRLEHLFCQFEQHMKHTSAWDTQSAIKAIIDLLSMVGRGDTKRETIKELERQNANLKSFIEIPDIDHGRLALLIDEQKKCIADLHAISGNIGHSLQSNELLNAIRQRLTVPGGLCDFDLPAYSHWLNQPFENRQSVLNEWFESLRVLQTAISLIVNVIRESTDAVDEVAEDGFYQRTLESNQSCLLIRVLLPADLNIFPEISAGKHRFSIRFLRTDNPAQRPEQEISDVKFKLACCTL